MIQRLQTSLKLPGSGFRVQGSGFRVQGSGFKVFYDRHALPMLLWYMENKCAKRVGAEGLGFRVQGSGRHSLLNALLAAVGFRLGYQLLRLRSSHMPGRST